MWTKKLIKTLFSSSRVLSTQEWLNKSCERMGALGDIREANVGMWSHVNCRGPPLILPSCIELVGDAPKTLH